MDAVHVDDDLLVLDKPAGLLAVPGRGPDGADCLAARARRLWPDALVVHRLDMATSGLMLFARGAAMQSLLGRAFAARAIAKRYVAVVNGLPVDDAGEIDAPLAADWPRRPRQRVDVACGRPSLTRWRVLAREAAAGTARLELEPVTGRAHQLRVHLLSIGHPIVGDALYADGFAPAPRLLLHATELRFAHPRSGRPLHFHCPPSF